MNNDTPGSQALRYLDDLKAGDRFLSGKHTIDEFQIKSFAAQFDPQPFHMDDEAAKATLFGGLAASGWHTAAITMRLLVGGLPLAGGIIGAGGEITWPKPTRPGDVLQVESEVVSVTPSRRVPIAEWSSFATKRAISRATCCSFRFSNWSCPGGLPDTARVSGR